MSPHHHQYLQSMNSLKYAQKAMQIFTLPKYNKQEEPIRLAVDPICQILGSSSYDTRSTETSIPFVNGTNSPQSIRTSIAPLSPFQDRVSLSFSQIEPENPKTPVRESLRRTLSGSNEITSGERQGVVILSLSSAPRFEPKVHEDEIIMTDLLKSKNVAFEVCYIDRESEESHGLTPHRTAGMAATAGGAEIKLPQLRINDYFVGVSLFRCMH